MIKRLINFIKYLLLPREVREVSKAYKELIKSQLYMEKHPRSSFSLEHKDFSEYFN